ncbi:hypothetical protein M0R19_07375 [Candidatus Pacearchaeota archaeon]|nr:hypothetical protein [Candidatus Pacearchaeota archaeon]
MLIKIFGLTDFIAGLLLIFGANNQLPSWGLYFFGIILVIKSGIGFWADFGSWIDLLSGAVFILSIFFNLPWIIGLILGLLLVQKGIFSFL